MSHDTYGMYFERAASVLTSAQNILNNGPDDRQITRARAAIELGEAYGRLAAIAHQREDYELRRRQAEEQRANYAVPLDDTDIDRPPFS
ncbi:hypothetical protein [Streptomyces violascens]|uniref:hypothetical protein n=1 Tax=Streptomyces violascens TaxID=67381 RepID=UPI00167B74D8|nr:hypothetical protein [Streptomyces violascens]GGU49846.1 hypothetical protein GCM10010289_82900 [Streptomyces violascens]